MTKICQWNCRSAISNKLNLENILQQQDISIALLSETWFKPGQYISFSGYNTVRNDRMDGKGGVAILIKNNMKFTELTGPNFDNILYISIKILLSNGVTVTLVSIYIKPQSKINTQTWSNFFSTF